MNALHILNNNNKEDNERHMKEQIQKANRLRVEKQAKQVQNRNR
jgi:hypothetical protein